MDAGGIEAVGRLVEDQQLGRAEQRAREPEPLAHAERVAADPPVPGELDERQRLVDARVRQPGGRGEHPQVVAAGPGGMEVAGLEHRADAQRGPVEGRVRAAEDERLAGRRRGQPEQDAQRGALARPVGPEEPGHGPGQERERDVVDGASEP